MNIKILSICCFALFSFTTIYAQNFSLNAHISSSKRVFPHDLDVNENGDYVNSGDMIGSLIYNKVSLDSTDGFFITLFDKNNSLLWSKTWTGGWYDLATDIDEEGNVYVMSSTNGGIIRFSDGYVINAESN